MPSRMRERKAWSRWRPFARRSPVLAPSQTSDRRQEGGFNSQRLGGHVVGRSRYDKGVTNPPNVERSRDDKGMTNRFTDWLTVGITKLAVLLRGSASHVP